MKILRVLSCLLVCLLLALPALADTDGDYEYYYDESLGGASLTGYTGSEAAIVVPDTLGGYPLLRVSFGAFSSSASIVSVTLPDCVQYMDGGAFAGCSSLLTVYLPDNLLEFTNPYPTGSASFYVDKDSATAQMMISTSSYPTCFIDPEYPAFKLCYMASPATGETVLGMSKYIGSEETAVIPDGVSHIGDSAFMIDNGATQNTSTKIVRMPDSVISLGMSAVYNLPNLAEVYLSSNISSWYHTTQPWEPGAFYTASSPKLYCPLDSTTFRTMTQDVTTLGVIDPAYPDYAWQNDGSGGRILCAYYGSASALVIPDGTTQIGANAFYGNHTLTSVTIPDGVTLIGDFAFYDTKKLASVKIPDSVTQIGSNAFEIFDYWADPDSYCKLTICLPANATLGSNPFDIHRTSLVVGHDSKTAEELMRLNDEFGEVLYFFSDPQYPDFTLGHYADELYLCGYTGNETIMDIPPICDVIATHVNLKTPACDTITHIVVPEGVTRLDERAFWGWPALQNISLPSTLREIGEYALNSSFPVLIIPEGVTSLPANMTGDSIIRYITIPASVTSIDNTAISTSGGTKPYKIYCWKGSYAETWAKARKLTVSYLDDCDYTFYVPEQIVADVGSSFDWKSRVAVAPMEPDFPYTISVSSSKPSVISVSEDGELSFNAYGTAKLTFSSEELNYSTRIDEVYVYEPVESFSIPAYIFRKQGSSGTLSVSDVVPAENTNPTYTWYRPDNGDLGAHTAYIEQYKVSDVNIAGVFPFTVTAASGVSREFTFVAYKTIGAATFRPFSGLLAAGMTVRPDISVTVDDIEYVSTVGTYTLTSSNTAVANPTADGALHLLSPGTATITATFLNGKTAKQTITVTGEKVYAIAGGVKAIESEAFLACPVTIAIIPDGCTSIGARAFAGCADLHRIEIPASVTAIAEDAFDGCSAELVIAAPAQSAAAAFAGAHGYTLETN